MKSLAPTAATYEKPTTSILAGIKMEKYPNRCNSHLSDLAEMFSF